MQKRNITNKNQRNSFLRLSLIGCFIVLLLGIGYFYTQNSRENSSLADTQPISPNQSLDNTINFEPSDPSENDTINEQKKNADKESVPTSQTIVATITTAGFYQDIARVRVLVTGTEDGSCDITLSSPDKKETISRQANIVLKGNQFSCDGFDIAKSEFKTNGEWDVKVVVTGSDGSSTAESILLVGN